MGAQGWGRTMRVPPAMTFAYTTVPGPRARQPDLTAHLRTATTSAHEELEASLALLSRVSDRHWFRTVLERFYGFHLVWERAIRRRPELRGFHGPRTRLPHLRRDLAALGSTTAELDGLARCEVAASLIDTHAGAVGSIYVMEGSTLGGQLIGRALAKAEWLPDGGLTYFHPYGAQTGEMWRSFRVWADDELDVTEHDAAAAGANRTFAMLREWLAA
jgi:heme oxygenase (biliverdin-IX-beta and delta-forming)